MKDKKILQAKKWREKITLKVLLLQSCLLPVSFAEANEKKPSGKSRDVENRHDSYIFVMLFGSCCLFF